MTRICWLCGLDYSEYPCIVIDEMGLCDFCWDEWYDLIEMFDVDFIINVEGWVWNE